MKIISDFTKDTQSSKPIPGSYEWWYFDALGKNGYSFVVIFYEGNPFSRRYIRKLEEGDGNALAEKYPAVSISVYKGGKPLFYSFEEFTVDRAEFSSNKPYGKVGNNTFRGVKKGNTIEYTLNLDQSVANGDSVTANLRFTAIEAPHNFFTVNEGKPSMEEKHIWNLVLPKCRVQGDFTVKGYTNQAFSFEGAGYHDHNTGFEPMKKSFTEWYWGRYHTNNSTVIYYLMLENGKWTKKAWLVHKNGRIKNLDNEIHMTETGLTLFGLNIARTLELAVEDTRVFIQKDVVLDSGPFYQRFEGKMLLHENGDVQQARGISEYIYPSRIYNKWFWPLVNMRIRYPGKTHWVQKKPVLYRWTWL